MFEKLGDCRLYNQYGPTESHVVTAFQLSGTPSQWPSLPPIGRPISNTEIYLLDPDHNLVPQGLPGNYISEENAFHADTLTVRNSLQADLFRIHSGMIPERDYIRLETLPAIYPAAASSIWEEVIAR